MYLSIYIYRFSYIYIHIYIHIYIYINMYIHKHIDFIPNIYNKLQNFKLVFTAITYLMFLGGTWYGSYKHF